MKLGLRTLGFRAYLATQFLGAFNDNAFRFTFIFFVLGAVDGEAAQGDWLGLSQVLFALPFIVFAAFAGLVADRWSKRSVIRAAKLAEILIMLAGVLAFGPASLPWLALVLFCMATQSAFFGPAKYGYLAETMAEDDLVAANAQVQFTTMLAIVSGQIFAGWVYARYADSLASGAIWFVGIAVLGTATSLAVAPVAAARSRLRLSVNPWPELKATWAGVRANRTLLYSILGNAHYFLLVAALQVYLAAYGKQGLGAAHDLGAALVATATVALGLGSLIAARWSEGRVELGLVPLGALAMTAGLVLVALVPPLPLVATGGAPGWLPDWIAMLWSLLLADGLWAPFAATALLGLAGGIYIVPLWALLQQYAPSQEKGRYLAFANMVGFCGIALSALLLWLPPQAGIGLSGQFLLLAAVALVGTVVSLRLLPFAFVRLLGWLLAHSCYRIEVRHAERLPSRGGALLLVNHVSWVDALVLGVCTHRKIHFLMYRRYYEWWPTHWLFRLVGCIPVASGDRPEVTAASLAKAGELLEQGRVVAIFGEGAVTRLGHLLPFRTGYQRIIEGRQIPIVPVYLGGLWGSVLSHQGGRFLRRIPRLSPRPVSVSFGQPLPADAPPYLARLAIGALAADAWARAPRVPLHLSFRREARRRTTAVLHDDGGRSLSPAGLLARAECLAGEMEPRLAGARRVALVLPSGLLCIMAQLALLQRGRVPILMDPGWDTETLAGRAARAGAQSWLVEQGGEQAGWLAEHGGGLPLVELDGAASLRGSLRCGLRVVFQLLLGWLPTGRGEGDPGRTAAVVFDRDGQPRTLTHAQLAAQVHGLRQVLDLRAEQVILTLSPPSSAYALAAGVWLPLLASTGAVWCTRGDWGKPAERGGQGEPEEQAERRARARHVGRVAERREASHLFATPDQLRTLVEGARPDSLGGLRFVLAARGELTRELEQAFTDRFGLRPCAGWAPDGCAGLVSLNTPDVRQPGVFQRGTRPGSVGHPLPGVHVLALAGVAPRDGTREPAAGALPPGESGQLCVTGASLAPDPDGGPGDLRAVHGSLDAEGFLSLERPALAARESGANVGHDSARGEPSGP